jgi:hypothetical protein
MVRASLPDIEMHGALARAGLPKHFDKPGRRQLVSELV